MYLDEMIARNAVSHIEFGDDTLKIRVGQDYGQLFIESDEGSGVRINLNVSEAETLCELLPAFIAIAQVSTEESEQEQPE